MLFTYLLYMTTGPFLAQWFLVAYQNLTGCGC